MSAVLKANWRTADSKGCGVEPGRCIFQSLLAVLRARYQGSEPQSPLLMKMNINIKYIYIYIYLNGFRKLETICVTFKLE